MRVEKTGEGDSDGPACSSPQADLTLAVKRPIAGLRSLQKLRFVDPHHIFILAHSIGPIEGALVAKAVPVQGFIAAETIGRSWFEYQLEVARSQPLLLGLSYDWVEASVRRGELCWSRFYVERLSPEAILKESPQCSSYLPRQGDVPYSYFQQVGDVNLSEEWKHIDIPVLVMYGTSDPLTSTGESRYLVNMINFFHPGRATYLELPGMSHEFDFQSSQSAALHALQSGQRGKFDTDALTQIVGWLNHVGRT
jgi:hypothetical protein